MLVLLGLMALALALYANALRNPFLIDDLDAIVSHPDVVKPGGILTLWGHDYWAGRSPEDRNLYRPIVIASYWLNARLPGAGMSPAGFRVVNVLLLATMAWLVWAWLMTSGGGGAKPQAAIAAALLVVCHPVHATVVNNIVGRADLLAMIGVMGFAVLQRRGRWTPLSLAGAVVTCVVALGSKETGLLIVPVAILQGMRRKDAIIVSVPLLLYLAARIAVVGVAPHYAPAVMDLTGNPLRGASLAERLPAALSLAWVYLRETVWPTMRSSHIPDALPTWSSGAAWMGLLVVIALACAIPGATQAWRRRHWLSVACVLGVGNFLLIGNLLTPIGVYAGYRLMLPFTIAAAMAVAIRRQVAYVAAIVCVLFSFLIVSHNAEWRDHVSLMKANLDRQPDNTRAAFLYGVALGEQNRQREGIEYVERAVQRHPESRQARHEYGKMLIVLGRFDDAIRNYEALLQAHPQDAGAMNQLAGLMMVVQEYGRANAWLTKALALTPTDAAAMHNAAVLAALTGQVNEAILRYEALLREHPDHSQGRVEYDELRRHLSQP
jgi:hypothetical protein